MNSAALQHTVGPAGAGRLRADQWVGYCERCAEDTVLTVVKADGRWTLRQLFGSWEQCDFDISCRRCGGRWAAHLHGGESVSVSDWLDQLRGGPGPDGLQQQEPA